MFACAPLPVWTYYPVSRRSSTRESHKLRYVSHSNRIIRSAQPLFRKTFGIHLYARFHLVCSTFDVSYSRRCHTSRYGVVKTIVLKTSSVSLDLCRTLTQYTRAPLVAGLALRTTIVFFCVVGIQRVSIDETLPIGVNADGYTNISIALPVTVCRNRKTITYATRYIHSVGEYNRTRIRKKGKRK